MKPENINQAYSIARERYAGVGVDTEKVLAQMQDFHLSMHCWQSDDVKGFEVQAELCPAVSSPPETIPERPFDIQNGYICNNNTNRYEKIFLNCIDMHLLQCRRSELWRDG